MAAVVDLADRSRTPLSISPASNVAPLMTTKATSSVTASAANDGESRRRSAGANPSRSPAGSVASTPESTSARPIAAIRRPPGTDSGASRSPSPQTSDPTTAVSTAAILSDPVDRRKIESRAKMTNGTDITVARAGGSRPVGGAPAAVRRDRAVALNERECPRFFTPTMWVSELSAVAAWFRPCGTFSIITRTPHTSHATTGVPARRSAVRS